MIWWIRLCRFIESGLPASVSPRTKSTLVSKTHYPCSPVRPAPFVATSKPWVYAERIVDHFKLTVYFERVFGSELDGSRSGKTELLDYALQTARVDPRRAIMIGDRSHDMIGARNNGMTAGASSMVTAVKRNWWTQEHTIFALHLRDCSTTPVRSVSAVRLLAEYRNGV